MKTKPNIMKTKFLFLSSFLVLLGLSTSLNAQWTNASTTEHDGDLRLNDGFPFMYLNDDAGGGGNSGIIMESGGTNLSWFFYQRPENQWKLTFSSAATTDDFIFNGNGEMGIGLADTRDKLHILDGNLRFSPVGSRGLMWEKSGASTANFLGAEIHYSNADLDIRTYRENSSDDADIVLNAADDIFITTNDQFDVNTGRVQFNSDSGEDHYYGTHFNVSLFSGGVGVRQDIDGNKAFNNDEESDKRAGGGGTEAVIYADDIGNVGIGTYYPTKQLEVEGVAQINADLILNNEGAINKIKGTDDVTKMQILNYTTAANSQSYFTMWGTDTGGNNRDGEFVVAGNYVRLFSGVTSGGANQFGTEAMRILSNGRVGIGTATPNAKLAVAGSITATGSVTWSDENLKEQIQDFEYGLDALKQIQPKTYKYSGEAGIDDDLLHTGVIAQEFEKIVPEAVFEFEHVEEDVDRNVISEATYKAVDEKAIQYILVNAVKEQQEIIEELKEKLDSQVHLNVSLQTKYDNLEAKVNSLISTQETVVELK